MTDTGWESCFLAKGLHFIQLQRLFDSLNYQGQNSAGLVGELGSGLACALQGDSAPRVSQQGPDPSQGRCLTVTESSRDLTLCADSCLNMIS